MHQNTFLFICLFYLFIVNSIQQKKKKLSCQVEKVNCIIFIPQLSTVNRLFSLFIFYFLCFFKVFCIFPFILLKINYEWNDISFAMFHKLTFIVVIDVWSYLAWVYIKAYLLYKVAIVVVILFFCFFVLFVRTTF